jgi:hypothetical protein
MPMTNKLLFEAGYAAFRYNPLFGFPPPDGITSLIPVTEQSNAINPSTGLRYAPQPTYTYRGVEQWGWAVGKTDGWQATASYVTGAHSLKAGYQGNRLDQLDQTLTDTTQLAYRFNLGIPNAVTYRLPDFGHRTITNLQGGFIQDSWTKDRLTLQGALRYDRASSYSPVEGNGTTRSSWTNPAPISFPVVPGVDAYNDITPRVAAAYDVFGNGKTAVKVNWGRYLAYAANDAPYISNNPAVTVVSVVANRGWTDTNGNKVVDCNLLNPAAQTVAGGDVCAAAIGNTANFGQTGAATIVNPAVLSGWGKRPGDYQWTAMVQQELIPRMSAEVSYTRRDFFGFLVTDDKNRNINTAYETYTLTAPVDSRLPNGGGYPITVYTPTAAANAVPSKTYLTWESDYGPERTSYWHGVDVTLNARLRGGLTASVGTQTGRAVIDNCAVATKYNQVNAVTNVAAGPDPRGCHSVDPFQTLVRGLASYTIPKIDVLVAMTIRSQPPVQLGAPALGATLGAGGNSAQWVVPNSVIAAALGHLPVGANATGTTTIQIADNVNRIYADNRRNQLDMRFAKVIRWGRTRSDIGLDLNNLLNTNYATGYNTTYQYSVGNTAAGGTWGNPTSIYGPRFLRINYTLDF